LEQETKITFQLYIIAIVFGKISPKKRISVPLAKTATTKPLLPQAPTQIAVAKEDRPILTSKLPKTIADNSRVGRLRRLLTISPLWYFSAMRRTFKLLKENIAVSKPEKNAERIIKNENKNILTITI